MYVKYVNVRNINTIHFSVNLVIMTRWKIYDFSLEKNDNCLIWQNTESSVRIISLLSHNSLEVSAFLYQKVK